VYLAGIARVVFEPRQVNVDRSGALLVSRHVSVFNVRPLRLPCKAWARSALIIFTSEVEIYSICVMPNSGEITTQSVVATAGSLSDVAISKPAIPLGTLSNTIGASTG